MEISAVLPSEVFEEEITNAKNFDFRGSFSKICFLFASILTNPICSLHKRAVQTMYVSSSALKIEKVVKLLFYTCLLPLAGACAFSGIIFRFLACAFSPAPYTYYHVENKEEPKLGKEINLFHLNVCGIGGGYPLLKGGCAPWEDRVEKIAGQILQQDTHVVMLSEVYDHELALLLKDRLCEKYSHFAFNFGHHPLGAPSGIMIISKVPLENLQFITFPRETLLGSIKFVGKGCACFSLSIDQKKIGIYYAHLQHSENDVGPTSKEFSARERQSEMMLEQMQRRREDLQLVGGDLNMGVKEFQKRFPNCEQDTSYAPTHFGHNFLISQASPSEAVCLDYLALRNTKAHISKERVDSFNEKTISSYKEALSDHHGIKVSIKV